MPQAPCIEQAPLGSRPTALILSGGASLGAWQGGVLWELERRGLSFGQVLGSSAGSINGAAYFQGTVGMLNELWRDVPRESFLDWSPGIAPPHLMDLSSVGRYLRTVISEERCRAAKRCVYYAVAVDLNGAGTVQAEYSPEPGGRWDGDLIDHILGSVAVPFVFAPWRVPARNGTPERLFVDGHTSCFVDLGPLLDRGALDLLFVNIVSPQERPRMAPRGFISTMINTLMQAQVTNALAAVKGRLAPSGVRVFEFTPSKPLDISVFLFKKHECRRIFDQGVADADLLFKDPSKYRRL